MARKKDNLVDFKDEDNFEIVQDLPVTDAPLPTPEPKLEDPEWTEWVMGQFEPEELDDGLPKVDGLRRLTRKLIGPIIEGSAEVKQFPCLENEYRATVEYTVVVLNKKRCDDTPYVITFRDAADAYYKNVKGIEYAKFPVAMASTRAEVRALRKALNLSVVASEEITDQTTEEDDFNGKISEGLITRIDIKCQQLNINVKKFINMGKGKYKNIEDVNLGTGTKMFMMLNKYQTQNEQIPESIIGYDPKWRGDLE